MCGDLEEDGPSGVEERLHNRFLNHARALLAQYAKAPQPKDQAALRHSSLKLHHGDRLVVPESPVRQDFLACADRPLLRCDPNRSLKPRLTPCWDTACVETLV